MTVGIGAKLRYEVLRRDRYTCRYCGSAAPDVFLQVDHVIPRSLGGKDVPANLQVLCEDCNQGKSMTMPERWLVKDTQKRQAEWERSGQRHGDVDDLSDMFTYLDARFTLESLPTADVLRCITHVMAEVFPYRPNCSELVVAAARFAAEQYVSSEAPV